MHNQPGPAAQQNEQQTAAPSQNIGCVAVIERLPESYHEAPVRLADGTRRVGRLDAAGQWQLAGFKADAHAHQYIGDVVAWFDERQPLIAAAPELLAALQAEEEWSAREQDGALDSEWDYERMVGDKRRAAIAKATGAAA